MATQNTDNSVMEKGRLIYVEPNELAGNNYKYNNKIPNNVAWNQEDLSINVDLTVVRPDRSDCGGVDYNEKIKNCVGRIQGDSNPMMSLLTGSKLRGSDDNTPTYLTTDYTNITYTDITSKGVRTSESLGISSIDINFDAHFYPLITIKFIDVRGESLLMPSDWQYEEFTNGKRQRGSFFSSFFHFPYARFLLTVKGFYGNRITFSLAVSEFKSEFMPETGDFGVTVSFIGYVYGVYCDIPMNLIMASPYYNSEHWDDRPEFKFATYGKEQCQIMTYPEFIDAFNKASTAIEEGTIDVDASIMEFKKGEDKIKALQEILNKHNEIYETLLSVTEEYNNNDGNLNYKHIIGTTYDIIFNKNQYLITYKDDVDEYAGKIDEFKRTYSDESDLFKNEFLLPNCSSSNDSNKSFIELVKNRYNDFKEFILSTSDKIRYGEVYALKSHGSTVVNGDIFNFDDSQVCLYGNIKEVCDAVKKNENEKVTIKDDGKLMGELHKYEGTCNTLPPYYFIYSNNAFVNTITTRINDLNIKNKENETYIQEKTIEAYSNVLGFTPSIENFFRMIFAHMDTFMDFFYTKILNPIKSDVQGRDSVFLGLNFHNSDTQYNNDKGGFVPAFPAYYVKNTATTGTGKVLEFPGESTELPNLKNIVEVGAVEKIINGITELNKQYQSTLEEISVGETTESETDDNTSSYNADEIITDIDGLFNYGNPWRTLKLLKDGNDEYRILYYFIYLMIRDAAFNVIHPEKSNDKITTIIDKRFEQLCQSNILSDIDNAKAVFTALEQNVMDGKCFVNDKDSYLNGSLSKRMVGISLSDLKYKYSPISNEKNLNKESVITNHTPIYFPDGLFVEKIYYLPNKNAVVRPNGCINYIQSSIIIDKTEVTNNENKLHTSRLKLGDTASTKYINSAIMAESAIKNKYTYTMVYYMEDNDFNSIFNLVRNDLSKNKTYNGCTTCTVWKNNQYNVLKSLFNDEGKYSFDSFFVPFILICGGYYTSNRDVDRTVYDIKTISENNSYRNEVYTENVLPYNYLLFRITDGEKTKTSGWNNWFFENLCRQDTENTQYYAFGLTILGLISGLYFNNSTSDNVVNVFNKILGGVDISDGENLSKIWSMRRCDLLYLCGAVYRRNYINNNGSDIFVRNKIDTEGYKEVYEYFNMSGDKFSGYKNSDIIFCKNRKLFGSNPTDEVWVNLISDLSETTKNKMEKYFKDWVDNDLIPNLKYLVYNYDDNISKNLSLFEVYAYNASDYKRGKIECYKHGSKGETWLRHLTLDTIDFMYLNKEVVDGNIYTTTENVRNFLNKIIDKLNDEQKENEKENSVVDIKKDQKRACYYLLKTLYDKWLCSYTDKSFTLKSVGDEYEYKKGRFCYNGSSTELNEFGSFIYIDQFYNDISSRFIVNPEMVVELVRGYVTGDLTTPNKSVYGFMSEIAEKSKLMMVALPVYNNLYNKEGIKKIFSPNKVYGDGNIEGRNLGNTYILMYTNEASKHPSDYMDGKYGGDDINITSIPNTTSPTNIELFETGDSGKLNYMVSAFGVTYSKQNQMYFKKINVSMDSPAVTEQVLQNTLHLSNEGTKGNDVEQPVGMGQNIYSIYANRAYTCTVEMMGCMNIMPLMYFQLNNIPMFRGLYMIINVKHNITPGNITTVFTGVKACIYSQPNVMSGIITDNILNAVGNGGNSSGIYDTSLNNAGVFGTIVMDKTVYTDKYNEITNNTGKSYGKDTKAFCGALQTKIKIKIHTYDANKNIIEAEREIEVNSNLKTKYENIFDEIYNCKVGDEFFVIKTVGVYDYRHVKKPDGSDGDSLSWHSYGVAVDINAGSKGNPYLSNTKYKYLKDINDDNTHLRTWDHPVVKIFNKYGFGWGIYKSSLDYMHFSYMSTPTSYNEGHPTKPGGIKRLLGR